MAAIVEGATSSHPPSCFRKKTICAITSTPPELGITLQRSNTDLSIYPGRSAMCPEYLVDCLGQEVSLQEILYKSGRAKE